MAMFKHFRDSDMYNLLLTYPFINIKYSGIISEIAIYRPNFKYEGYIKEFG